MNERTPSNQPDSSEPANKSIMVRHAGAIVGGAAAAALGVANPYLGIVAAALSPFLASRIDFVIAQRSERFQQVLRDQGATEADFSDERIGTSTEKIDLARKVIEAALESASEGKRKLLAHILLRGVRAEVEAQILLAQRIARTVSRTDDLEIVILGALSKVHKQADGATLSALKTSTGVEDANLLRSGLSVLEAEGLVHFQGGSRDEFRVSDYGECVLGELRKALATGVQ